MDRRRLLTVLAGGARRPLASSPQLLTVACGNSISAASQWQGASFSTRSELQVANLFAGGAMRFNRITSSTRTDRNGVYGYSGQTLTTINADIDAAWITTLDTGSLTPDLVIGLALTENSISQGHLISTIQADIDAWISKIKIKWPSAKIIICTPRVSLSYNTAALVLVYQQTRDYILAKDNGRTVFACRMDSYENAASLGTPTVTTITGSISGTVLTVTATDGPVGIGTKLIGAGVTTATISSYGTGRGGTGTYNISVSQTVSSQSMTSTTYTDEAVHPNTRGSMLNARRLAATLSRIARSWTTPYTIQSSNQTLTGSAAATGAGISGTWPTGTSILSTAYATHVATALQPGFQQAISGVATVVGSSSPVDFGSSNFGSKAMTPTQISPYAVVQLVSGAEYLSFVALEPRVADGGGNTFQYGLVQGSSEVEPDWIDGDILTFVSPPLLANSGSITAEINYIRAKLKLNQDAAGSVVFRVLEQGVRIVA